MRTAQTSLQKVFKVLTKVDCIRGFRNVAATIYSERLDKVRVMAFLFSGRRKYKNTSESTFPFEPRTSIVVGPHSVSTMTPEVMPIVSCRDRVVGSV